jgi:hypothetical protein
MRTRQFRALVVSGLLMFLLSTTSAMAASRDRDGWWPRERPSIGKVLKYLKKAFGISTNADGLTLPTP